MPIIRCLWPLNIKSILNLCGGINLYAFTCLPMGLTSSPRIFTKILKPVFATLRAKFGHSCIGYFDDSLNLADSYAETERATLHAVELLISLGFMIHPEKSILIPTQVIKFLGFVLNSMLMIVQLTDKTAVKILQFCLYFSPEGKAFTIREVASLIRSLISSCRVSNTAAFITAV